MLHHLHQHDEQNLQEQNGIFETELLEDTIDLQDLKELFIQLSEIIQ
jgi:hypothetical protein